MNKLLFVLPNLFPYGSQKVSVSVLNSLNCKKYEKILAVARNDESSLWEELDSTIKVNRLNNNRTYKSYFQLIKLINKEKPKLIFSTLGYMNLILIFTKPFIPKDTFIIVRESNTPSISLLSTKRPTINKLLYKFFYKYADIIICQSEYMKNDLIKNFNIPEHKLLKIYNPVDFEKIDQSKHGHGNRLDVTKFNYLAIGSLTRQKGFDLLIEAFATVVLVVPDARLTILGEGEERNELEILIKQLHLQSSVLLAGYQQDPFGFLLDADLLVSSSRWEGLPNVVLESLASGVPVVATRCPGGTAELIQDGVNGLLVNSESSASLARGMVLAHEKKDSFTWESVRGSVDKFERSRIVTEYDNLFGAFSRKVQ